MSSANVFCKVCDADITAMENYIREGLPNVLETIEKAKGETLGQMEKMFIFGMKYALNEKKFMLIPGEKITIRNIADHVRMKMTADKNHFTLNPRSRTKNFKPKNTVDTIIGMIYGDPVALKKIKKEVKPIDHLKKRLFDAISNLFKQLNLEVSGENPNLVNEMIHIECDDSADIKGSVKCIFCTKEFVVFCKQSSSSNFKRHFVKCCATAPTTQVDIPTTSQSDTTVELNIEPHTTTCAETESLENSKVLHSQMIVQKIKCF